MDTNIIAPTKTLPATLDEETENIQQASEGLLPLLKFKKGKYYVGETEVAAGGEYLAYCRDWVLGWVKFIDGELVEKRIGRVADGFKPSEREELDEQDQSKWPLGLDGKPSDPWQLQDYLPLENIKSGDRLLFVTGSAGGRMAVRGLCNKYAYNAKRGLPTIALAVAQFSSKTFGPVQRPDFLIVRWEHDRTEAPPSAGQLMNDEIPF